MKIEIKMPDNLQYTYRIGMITEDANYLYTCTKIQVVSIHHVLIEFKRESKKNRISFDNSPVKDSCTIEWFNPLYFSVEKGERDDL